MPSSVNTGAVRLYVYELRSEDAENSEHPPRRYGTQESIHDTLASANTALIREADRLSWECELNIWIKNKSDDGTYYWASGREGSRCHYYYHLGVQRREATEGELASKSAEELEEMRLDSFKQQQRAELRADSAFIKRVEQEVVGELKKDLKRDATKYEALRLRMEGELRKEIKQEIRAEEGEEYWHRKIKQEDLKRKRDEEDAVRRVGDDSGSQDMKENVKPETLFDDGKVWHFGTSAIPSKRPRNLLEEATGE